MAGAVWRAAAWAGSRGGGMCVLCVERWGGRESQEGWRIEYVVYVGCEGARAFLVHDFVPSALCFLLPLSVYEPTIHPRQSYTNTDEQEATAAAAEKRAAVLSGFQLAQQNPRAYLLQQQDASSSSTNGGGGEGGGGLSFFVQERLKEGTKPGTGFPAGKRLARLVAAGVCLVWGNVAGGWVVERVKKMAKPSGLSPSPRSTLFKPIPNTHLHARGHGHQACGRAGRASGSCAWRGMTST